MEIEKIRFAAFTLDPYWMPYKDGNETKFGGVAGHMLPFLVKHMNLKNYDLVDYGPGYGFEYSPGNWSGAIGAVIRKEADILLGMYIASDELDSFVSFTTGATDSNYGVLSIPALDKSEKDTNLLSSIGWQALVLLICAWIILSIIYFLFKIEGPITGTYIQEEDNSFSGILLSFYGLMFQRGFRYEAVYTGRRLLVAGWLLMVSVVMTVVAGTLYSTLTITEVPERIDAMVDLLKFPNLKIYTAIGNVMDTYFQRSDNPDMQEIWRRILKDNGWQPTVAFFDPSFMNQVSFGQSAVITNKNYIIPAIVSHYCSIDKRSYYISKEDYYSVPLVPLHMKGLCTNVVEALTYSFILLGEMGFLVKWKQISDVQSSACLLVSTDTSIGPLGVKELKQSFYLVLIGELLALAALFGEILWVSYRHWFIKK